MKVLNIREFTGPDMIPEIRATLAQLKAIGAVVPKIVASGEWDLMGKYTVPVKEENSDIDPLYIGHKQIKVGTDKMQPIEGSTVRLYSIAEGDEISDEDAAALGDTNLLNPLDENGRKPRAPRGSKGKGKGKAAA